MAARTELSKHVRTLETDPFHEKKKLQPVTSAANI